MNKFLRSFLLVGALSIATQRAEAEGSVVSFDERGIAVVNEEPFFPIGLFTYHLDDIVLKEMKELKFNTIVHGFAPHQLDLIHSNDLRAICHTSDEWIAAAKDHPALLAWYLTDEPEGHGISPAEVKQSYERMKAIDPHHPVGVCHFLYEALHDYSEARDFSMTSVYPVTANRDVPLLNVGIHTAQARATNRNGAPNWSYIQVFGGPETEGGKWAQPTPEEVRAMAFIALVHGANGILYFSYWPKAPETWKSLGALNRDLHRLAPRLMEQGEELYVNTSNKSVQARARRTAEGVILIAVNTTAEPVHTAIYVKGTGKATAKLMFEERSVPLARSNIRDHFAPHAAQVYVWP